MIKQFMSANETVGLVIFTIVECAAKAQNSTNVVYTCRANPFMRPWSYHSNSSRVGVLESPGFSLVFSSLFVSFVVFGDTFVKGILEVRVGHEGLNGEEDRSDLESGTPLVLEDIETDAAKLVDVRVVDLSAEKNLRRSHRVVFGEEELTVEKTTFEGSAGRSTDLHHKVTSVGSGGSCENSGNGLFGQVLGFFDNSWRNC